MKLLVLDTETGGLDPDKHSILTMGMAIWDDGKVTPLKEIAIKEPVLNVTVGAMAINRIDLRKYKGVAPLEAVKDFEGILDRHFGFSGIVTLAGHNIGFDISFLKRLYKVAERDWPSRISHRSVDTSSMLGFLTMAGHFDKQPGMSAALEHLGVEQAPEDRHTALGDAIATAEMITALLEKVKPHE